jgi:hypothetical protein
MAILKKIENNELYLYMNGKLIYKRWLDTGVSKVFDVMAYDKYTLTSIRDLGDENPPGQESTLVRNSGSQSEPLKS